MSLVDTQLSAAEVLRAFHHDEPYLFLGSAFTALGIVAAAICALRRKADALLLSMAVFAILYGHRLWIQADLLRITVPSSLFFDRIRAAIDFLVPVPAFVFFQVAGFMGRWGKFVTAALSALFLSLVVAAFFSDSLGTLYAINNTFVILALVAMVVGTLRAGARDRDSRVVRAGLLCFAAAALWDNVIGALVRPTRIEPYGFALFLASLGYVAGRRAVERDVSLGEIQKELELARNMQQSILPAAFPNSDRLRVAARYVPMTSVAGDFYDFLITDDHRAGLLIADVSGHGIPAALIASMVKLAASSQRANSDHPAQLLTGMNRALCGNTQGQYVTAAYLYLDAQTHEMRYSAAGHPCMMLMRRGAVLDITANGLLLAAYDGAAYTERTLPIESGDRLLLYTDGVLEARNAQGEFFGEELLVSALRDTASLPPAEAAEDLIARVQQWARAQEDDLTVLICDVLAPI